MLCEVEIGKGRDLLFPILQVAQSKGTQEEDKPVVLFNNPELNKVDKVFEFGCPSLLCHNWLESLMEKQNPLLSNLFLEGGEKSSGNKRPHLGPLAISFPVIWSCTTQPEEEKRRCYNYFQQAAQLTKGWKLKLDTNKYFSME